MRTTAYVPLLALTSMLVVGCGVDPVAPNPNDRPSLITYGTPSGAAHPEVVLIIMEVAGQPAFRCTGTLMTPRVVLTAGHCSGAPGEFSGMRIFTESDVDNGNNNYPFAGPNTVEAARWYTHPAYDSDQFFLNDVGVIVLAQSVTLPAGASYGRLPALNALDALKPSARTTFTAVGYGLQRINPVFVEAMRVRMQASPHLIQINTGFTGSRSLLLSNNARTGGTCFGDSGGPNYVGTSSVVGAVTSFGINGNCAGTGGVFRMDRADVLAFVTPFLTP
jgi:secreted trypsin-like serine protease